MCHRGGFFIFNFIWAMWSRVSFCTSISNDDRGLKPLDARTYLALVACFVLFLGGCYYFCFTYQLGAGVEAEWWLKDVYSYKDHVAARTPSPKIIIMSGSNGLFGVDSGVIGDLTGYPAVNLAGHGGMDLEFFYVKLKEHISEGDIVVMPLEFAFLQRNRPTDWFVNNMLAWGKEDYLSKLDVANLLGFIISVPKARVYEGLLRKGYTQKITAEEEIIEKLERILQEEGGAWRGYRYTSLNSYGDIVSGPEMTEEFKKTVDKGYFYYGGWDISERFFRMSAKIKTLVEEHHGRLILTWSVSMPNKHFDLSRKKDQNIIEKIRTNLAMESVAIECEPEDFYFDRELFFDTHYHLNMRGIAARSESLAECINRVMGR